MATDYAQLSNVVTAVKFYYFNDADQVWNTTLNAGAGGFESWVDANYASYGISGAQQGTSMRWNVTRPAGVAIPFKLAARQVITSTPAGDPVIWDYPFYPFISRPVTVTD